MKWFSNLKIGKKLGLGFGIVLLMSAVLGGLSMIELSNVDKASAEISTDWEPSVRELGEIRFLMQAVRRYELSGLLAADSASRERSVANGEGAVAQLADTAKKYEPMVTSAEER